MESTNSLISSSKSIKDYLSKLQEQANSIKEKTKILRKYKIFDKKLDQFENEVIIRLFQFNRVFIPIIGKISSGKSTFLNCLLGNDILHSGNGISTKFACIIRYTDLDEPQLFSTKIKTMKSTLSNKIRDYFSFEEDVLITSGKENVRMEIMKINEELELTELKEKEYEAYSEEEKLSKVNEFFYILKIRIPGLENLSNISEYVDFIDVPGLNETCTFFIEKIFPKIFSCAYSLIFLLDSTKFENKDYLNILKQLTILIKLFYEENSACSILKNSVYILNKWDLIKEEDQNLVRKTANTIISKNLIENLTSEYLLPCDSKSTLNTFKLLNFHKYLEMEVDEFKMDDNLMEIYEGDWKVYILESLARYLKKPLPPRNIDSYILLEDQDYLDFVEHNNIIITTEYEKVIKSKNLIENDVNINKNEFLVMYYLHSKSKHIIKEEKQKDKKVLPFFDIVTKINEILKNQIHSELQLIEKSITEYKNDLKLELKSKIKESKKNYNQIRQHQNFLTKLIEKYKNLIHESRTKLNENLEKFKMENNNSENNNENYLSLLFEIIFNFIQDLKIELNKLFTNIEIDEECCLYVKTTFENNLNELLNILNNEVEIEDDKISINLDDTFDIAIYIDLHYKIQKIRNYIFTYKLKKQSYDVFKLFGLNSLQPLFDLLIIKEILELICILNNIPDIISNNDQNTDYREDLRDVDDSLTN